MPQLLVPHHCAFCVGISMRLFRKALASSSFFPVCVPIFSVQVRIYLAQTNLITFWLMRPERVLPCRLWWITLYFRRLFIQHKHFFNNVECVFLVGLSRGRSSRAMRYDLAQWSFVNNMAELQLWMNTCTNMSNRPRRAQRIVMPSIIINIHF